MEKYGVAQTFDSCEMYMLQISKKKDQASFKHLDVCNIYISVSLTVEWTNGVYTELFFYMAVYYALASTCL